MAADVKTETHLKISHLLHPAIRFSFQREKDALSSNEQGPKYIVNDANFRLCSFHGEK